MNGRNECDRFQERLDRFAAEAPTDEDERAIRDHASACQECALLLRMEEHYLAADVEEIEAEVPDRYVDEMADRVEEALAARSRRERTEPPIRRRRWLVPVQAAAIVCLAVGAGFLEAELRSVRGREEALLERVADQERRIAALDARTAAPMIEQTARRAAAREWERIVSRSDLVRVADLRDLLEGLPPDALVLGADEAAMLAKRIPSRPDETWKASLREASTEDGLRAGEALRLVRALDPTTPLPPRDLLFRLAREARGSTDS